MKTTTIILAAIALLGFGSCEKDVPTPEKITTAVGDWSISKTEVNNFTNGYNRIEAPFIPVSFYADGELLMDSTNYFDFVQTSDSLFIDVSTTPINLKGRWEKTRTKSSLTLYSEKDGTTGFITKKIEFILD